MEKYGVDYKNNKYERSKLTLRIVTMYRRKKEYFSAIKYFIRAFIDSPKCIVDILKRKIQNREFTEFYNDII